MPSRLRPGRPFASPYNKRVKRLVFALLLVAAACSHGPEVPVNTLLWRLGEWRTPAGSRGRTAAAVVISFRASGEYVEHYCRVIEESDEAVYIVGDGPHIIVIGRWLKRDGEVTATRNTIWRSAGPPAPRDPLCGDVTFTVTGKSVITKEGQYSPVTRLVTPDFEVYVNDARKKGTSCAPPPPSR